MVLVTAHRAPDVNCPCVDAKTLDSKRPLAIVSVPSRRREVPAFHVDFLPLLLYVSRLHMLGALFSLVLCR